MTACCSLSPKFTLVEGKASESFGLHTGLAEQSGVCNYSKDCRQTLSKFTQLPPVLPRLPTPKRQVGAGGRQAQPRALASPTQRKSLLAFRNWPVMQPFSPERTRIYHTLARQEMQQDTVQNLVYCSHNR